MKMNFRQKQILTDCRRFSLIVSLTMLATLLTFSAPQAMEAGVDPSDQNLMNGPLSATPYYNQVRTERLNNLRDYLHQQGMSLVPGLPEAVRVPALHATEELQALRDELGIPLCDANDKSVLAAVVRPAKSMMQSPDEVQEEALWFSPEYRHHGFFPTNDTMTMGMNFRERAFQNQFEFLLHPFFGQSWLTQNNYYGLESRLSLRDPFREDHNKTVAFISLQIIGGNPQLMNQRTGFDMHAEYRFTDTVSLNAGFREGYNANLGNYALVRWQVLKLGSP